MGRKQQGASAAGGANRKGIGEFAEAHFFCTPSAMHPSTTVEAPSSALVPLARLEAKPWSRVGLGRSYTYALIAAGKFPRPVKVGRASRWVQAEVDSWVQARIADRDATCGVEG